MLKARYKTARDSHAQLIMCAKPDAGGALTCPGTFGVAVMGLGKPSVRVYGIFRRNSKGVYTISERNRKRVKAGLEPRLRRRYVRDTLGDGPLWLTHSDLGLHGNQAGELVHDLPVRAECPRCGELNEIDPAEGLP
jgi:hypothetical protein